MARTAPTPELFFQTANAYQQTAAIRSAIELDLFTAIADVDPATAAAVAARCQASERGIRILCDYLTIHGFLEKADGAYRLGDMAAAFLNRRSPAYVGSSIDFLTAPDIIGRFDLLTDTIRHGFLPREQSTMSDENPIWVTFARAMAPLMMPAAQALAGLVASRDPLRVLDIAAGHGVFGIMVAKQNPQARIVALDWPSVLDVAEENARVFGVADRVSRLEGDALSIEYGDGFDLALVTNFLHHFDGAECTAFLRKVAAALTPGGRVAILEFVPNPDRISPPAAAAFSLNMLASTPRGDAYTFDELRGFLDAAGFRDASLHRLMAGQAIVLASLASPR